MKLSGFQLGLLAVGGFVSVVLLNVLAKYQSDEAFRDHLKSSLSPADLLAVRTRRVNEEQMVPVTITDVDASGLDGDDNEQD